MYFSLGNYENIGQKEDNMVMPCNSKYFSVDIIELKVFYKILLYTVGGISNFAGFKQNFTFQAKLSFASFEVYGVIKRPKFWS